MRNMKDSTLNWDPRLSTEKKSTPNTRANSLQENDQQNEDTNGMTFTHAVFVTISAASNISSTIVDRRAK